MNEAFYRWVDSKHEENWGWDTCDKKAFEAGYNSGYRACQVESDIEDDFQTDEFGNEYEYPDDSDDFPMYLEYDDWKADQWNIDTDY